MKVNLSSLMVIISEEEKNLSRYSYAVKDYIFNTSVVELDGKTNIVEDNKENFDINLKGLVNSVEKINKLKGVLYEKNNSLKLSDGRTISKAITDNMYLRKLKSSYEDLLEYKNTKKRVSEVNNSYFECKTLNYNQDEIRKKLDELDKIIQNTEFEIAKLNSEEFII